MKKYLIFQISLCEGSKLYSFAEFYRNILKEYKKCTLDQFKKLIDFNIQNSNSYFICSLIEIKQRLQ